MKNIQIFTSRRLPFLHPVDENHYYYLLTDDRQGGCLLEGQRLRLHYSVLRLMQAWRTQGLSGLQCCH